MSQVTRSPGPAAVVAETWLAAFERALCSRERPALEALFTERAGWRDLVAFTWNLRQAHDRESICDLMLAVSGDIRPAELRLDPERPIPAVAHGEDASDVELFFTFSTRAGTGRGLAIIAADGTAGGGPRARTLLTELVSLSEAPAVWPTEGRFDKAHPDKRWTAHLDAQRSYSDRDPEVLVVGGGQFGVMTAACLTRLGVDCLVVDRKPRVGDAWRSRYESLILHQPHNILHFAFLPFPESFPEYVPKDKIAEWFEAYVSVLDINFWANTEFCGAAYDADTGRWTVTLLRDDGTERTVRPAHVVLATGGSNIPNIPDLPGLEEFRGAVLHASEFRDGSDFAGKRTLVVGTGTTAHDLAFDILRAGGEPTLLQRGPLISIDLPTANVLYGDYNGRAVPTDLIDFRFLAGGIFTQMRDGFREFQRWADEEDSELHQKLAARGMQLWSGEDDTGFYYSFLQTQGGFYINVGASEAIADGDIGVLQLGDLGRIVNDGLLLSDGSKSSFDAIIFATGYWPAQAGIERDFGHEVAAELGPVWGFDTDGEMRNVLKPTAQEGLWLMMGSIPQARWHSPLIALLIKAELLGLVPAEFKRADHPSRTPRTDLPAVAEARRTGAAHRSAERERAHEQAAS